MRVLIDADGCPVVDEAVRIARRYGVECLILCDTAHRIEREGAQTLVCDKGADSVDFALVNRLARGDLAVTQDYGLAALCLARGARVLDQDGREYTAGNIDALLTLRHAAAKARRAGHRMRGKPKRTVAQDAAFSTNFPQILRSLLDESDNMSDNIRINTEI